MTSRLYAQIRKNFPEFNLLPETSDTAEAAQAPAPDAAPDGTVAKPGTSEPQPTQNGASESNASQGQADAGSGASQTKSQSPEDSAEKGIRKVNGLRELIGVASGEPIFLNIECTVDAEGAREGRKGGQSVQSCALDAPSCQLRNLRHNGRAFYPCPAGHCRTGAPSRQRERAAYVLGLLHLVQGSPFRCTLPPNYRTAPGGRNRSEYAASF